MTENDFLNIYSKRLNDFVNIYKDKIKNYSNESYQNIKDEIAKHNILISEKGNSLISDVLIENRIEPNSVVILKDLSEATLSSVLAQKTFSILLRYRKEYESISTPVLSEALCRDFPEDCLKGL